MKLRVKAYARNQIETQYTVGVNWFQEALVVEEDFQNDALNGADVTSIYKLAATSIQGEDYLLKPTKVLKLEFEIQVAEYNYKNVWGDGPLEEPSYV